MSHRLKIVLFCHVYSFIKIKTRPNTIWYSCCAFRAQLQCRKIRLFHRNLSLLPARYRTFLPCQRSSVGGESTSMLNEIIIPLLPTVRIKPSLIDLSCVGTDDYVVKLICLSCLRWRVGHYFKAAFYFAYVHW